MPTEPAAYGQLLNEATSFWADHTVWWFGKWATVAVLRAAAASPAYHRAVAQKAAALATATQTEPPVPPTPPTLADLVRTAFEVVLLIYGPTLPFGGYWVRAARDFVLRYLPDLPPPAGLAYRGLG